MTPGSAACNDSPPFTYELPPERIAQRPVVPYHDARLLIVGRRAGKMSSSTYFSITDFLRPSDIVVFNDSKVIPARLFGRLASLEVEVLLLRHIDAGAWICTGRPLKKFKAGRRIGFNPVLTATVGERLSEREVILEFEVTQGTIRDAVDRAGLMPIPPYIRGGRSDETDRRDYQTFFAREEGSIAAPTASLHFTPQLFERLRGHGCGIEYLTLHVGAASIAALWQNERLHKPAAEQYVHDAPLLRRLTAAKKDGARVVAVGTTVVRALESMARVGSGLDNGLAETDMFITRPFEFKIVDVLVTNFHQPGTSHLLLVEAFMGDRRTLEKSYRYALQDNFRFLSYGDGMLIQD